MAVKKHGPKCIITDALYFLYFEDEIRQYLLDTFGYEGITGMVINFKTEEDMFVFLLRWS